nr:hypothetical protein [Mucilaginibacter sp. SP1R1]
MYCQFLHSKTAFELKQSAESVDLVDKTVDYIL